MRQLSARVSSLYYAADSSTQPSQSQGPLHLLLQQLMNTLSLRVSLLVAFHSTKLMLLGLGENRQVRYCSSLELAKRSLYANL